MAANHVFYYFGDDEGYFRALHGEFVRQTRITLEFKRAYEVSESEIQSLFLKIYREQPSAVFIDFSKQSQDYFHLARLIARTPLEHKMVTVGLVDYLSPPEILAESIATGTNLIHIKSPETYDVVFDVTKIIAPEEIGEHGFATATLKDDLDVGIPGKVGFVDANSMHVETDFNLSKGSRLKVKHFWQKGRIVPSGEVFVREVSHKNLFYHFAKSADLDFLFVDDFLPPEGMEMEKVTEKRAEREETIKFHKKQLKKWIDDNVSRSQEKKGKMLVVDRDLHFYQNQTRSDKHSYIIRSIPFLEDISGEMDRLHPQVIAFSLDSPEQENPRNHHQKLVKLAEAIKAKYKELNPFIVVFNSPIGSKDMQEVLGYTNVMATENPLSVELLVKMADLYEKKRNTQQENEPAPLLDKVFLRKTHEATLCEFTTKIKVMKLSETDMLFQCEDTLPIGTNIHLYNPVEMYVNVQPTKNPSNPPVYQGLIHCLGEAQKKELRRFVNSVFFREHDAAVQTDNDEFKRLNEAKLQEKIAEASKKLEEEMAKKEKERLEGEKKAEAEKIAAEKAPIEPES